MPTAVSKGQNKTTQRHLMTCDLNAPDVETAFLIGADTDVPLDDSKDRVLTNRVHQDVELDRLHGGHFWSPKTSSNQPL